MQKMQQMQKFGCAGNSCIFCIFCIRGGYLQNRACRMSGNEGHGGRNANI
jgi:hypothetical protein